MSENWAGWLPPSIARAQRLEDIAEARAERAAERARDDARAAAEDRAVAAYRAAAESRGDVVSALALAQGRDIGRSLGDVLADARAAAENEDARADARDRRQEWMGAAEPSIGRSSWPSSEYELDRQIQRASDLHRDLVMFMARRNYPAAEARARKVQRSSAGEFNYATGLTPR